MSDTGPNPATYSRHGVPYISQDLQEMLNQNTIAKRVPPIYTDYIIDSLVSLF